MFIEGLKFILGVGLGLIILLVAMSLLISVFNINTRDDTDPPDGRSGLKIYIDHKTGVEYLGISKGGLVKRETKKHE